MSREIKSLYRREGLKPPDGKGIHTKVAHQCVVNYLKKGFSKDEAWKRCMGGIGREKAVKKAHQSSKYQRK